MRLRRPSIRSVTASRWASGRTRRCPAPHSERSIASSYPGKGCAATMRRSWKTNPKGCEASRLRVQVAQVKAPTTRLVPGVLADEAVEPPFDAAQEVEVGGVDREHERAVEHRGVEPVRQNELHSVRASAYARALLPLVDPREAVQ